MKKHLSFSLAALILISTNIVAFAARSEGVGDSGDIWEYDTEGGNCYSNYYHPSKLHGSTAKSSKQTSLVHRKCAGTWSKASVKATMRGNKAYWHRCGIDRECN